MEDQVIANDYFPGMLAHYTIWLPPTLLKFPFVYSHKNALSAVLLQTLVTSMFVKNNEFRRRWKEASVDYFKAISEHSPGYEPVISRIRNRSATATFGSICVEVH